jgi:mycothiol synthase
MYLNIQAAPLYRCDLDLVAIAPEGDVAAFTTVWYDDVIRCGIFEPVGTKPEHQRCGLARSLLGEGMRRLKKMGATYAMTTGGTPPANALYQSVLGPYYDIHQPWEKRWPG